MHQQQTTSYTGSRELQVQPAPGDPLVASPHVFMSLCWCSCVNTPLAPQVMRRAQSNSPRIPPKKYHSFREPRSSDLDNLLLLPGYKPRRRRPPSYPAHVSPSRDHLHLPRIRVTCAPEPAPNTSQPVMRRRSLARSPDLRGRSPGRRVSRRTTKPFLPPP